MTVPFNTFIEGLPTATLAGSEGIPLVQSGVSSAASAAAVAALAPGSSTQFTTVAVNTTLSPTVTSVLVNAAAGGITITLDTAVGATGLRVIKKIDASANAVTLLTTGGQTIDGASSSGVANRYSSITLKSDNANWWII